jgi:hypothetical protein
MLKNLPKVWYQVRGSVVLHDLYTFDVKTARQWADEGLDVIEYVPTQRLPAAPRPR